MAFSQSRGLEKPRDDIPYVHSGTNDLCLYWITPASAIPWCPPGSPSHLHGCHVTVCVNQDLKGQDMETLVHCAPATCAMVPWKGYGWQSVPRGSMPGRNKGDKCWGPVKELWRYLVLLRGSRGGFPRDAQVEPGKERVPTQGLEASLRGRSMQHHTRINCLGNKRDLPGQAGQGQHEWRCQWPPLTPPEFPDSPT